MQLQLWAHKLLCLLTVSKTNQNNEKDLSEVLSMIGIKQWINHDTSLLSSFWASFQSNEKS